MTSDDDKNKDCAEVSDANRAKKIATISLFVAIFAAALSMAALMKPFY